MFENLTDKLGNVFKGPKLTKISPKKTYSGMIGGYLLAIINVNIFLFHTLLITDPKGIPFC